MRVSHSAHLEVMDLHIASIAASRALCLCMGMELQGMRSDKCRTMNSSRMSHGCRLCVQGT